jgi:hypothetical protein
MVGIDQDFIIGTEPPLSPAGLTPFAISSRCSAGQRRGR